MTCHCRTLEEHSAREYQYASQTANAEVERLKKELSKFASPTADQYEIKEVATVGRHLILRVRYASCSACAYEGDKVMVFLNTTAEMALKWKRIDPHFRAEEKIQIQSAPSPAARFPASEQGWKDAFAYATLKTK